MVCAVVAVVRATPHTLRKCKICIRPSEGRLSPLVGTTMSQNGVAVRMPNFEFAAGYFWLGARANGRMSRRLIGSEKFGIKEIAEG